ncbi:MAG: anti-sigma factor [Planctomycetes bacterium]|nr:anti-sigma factor [Planctomycetota bacterium]
MKCEEVIPLLREYVDRELGDADARRIEEHLDDCHECASIVRDENELKLVIRKHVRPDPAPANLANVIVRKLREEAQPARRWSIQRIITLGFIASAATIFVVFTTLMIISNQQHQNAMRLLDLMIDDHVKASNFDPDELVDCKAVGAEEVEEWIRSHRTDNFRVPELESGNVKMLGAKCCMVGGREVEVVFYEWDGKRTSLFIVSDEENVLQAADPANLVDADKAMMSRRGFNVVCWKRDETFFALVTGSEERSIVETIGRSYN